MLDLEELKRLGKEATERPWRILPTSYTDLWVIEIDNGRLLAMLGPDAAFIVAARNNWDALLELAEKGQEVDKLKGDLEKVTRQRDAYLANLSLSVRRRLEAQL